MTFDPISIIAAGSAAVGAATGGAGAAVPPPVVEQVQQQSIQAVENVAPQVEAFVETYVPEPQQQIIDQAVAEIDAQVQQAVPIAPTAPEPAPVPLPAPVQAPVPTPTPAIAQAEKTPTVLPPAYSPSPGSTASQIPAHHWQPGALTAPQLAFDPAHPRDVELARRIIAEAFKAIGLPYQWGGGDLDGPTIGDGTGGPNPGFDCSALVRWAVYQATGGAVELPRTSQIQYGAGVTIPRSEAQPGDLLFGNWQSDGANHVAIYLGAGRMIEAPQTGQLVQISDVRDDMVPVRIT